MDKLLCASHLILFDAAKFNFKNIHSFSGRRRPRPHFALACILEGKGIFRDFSGNRTIEATAGDLVFLPRDTDYASSWQGSENISYITLYFLFHSPGLFSNYTDFKLQKVTPKNKEKTEQFFTFILKNKEKKESSFEVLSKFYEILSELLPHLEQKQKKECTPEIRLVLDYIEEHCEAPITIDDLARLCHISTSRFFTNFKGATGKTPVEYIQHLRINRSIFYLLHHDHLSIESISAMVGFESSSYFRRVFKKITGMSPRAYRKTMPDI